MPALLSPVYGSLPGKLLNPGHGLGYSSCSPVQGPSLPSCNRTIGPTLDNGSKWPTLAGTPSSVRQRASAQIAKSSRLHRKRTCDSSIQVPFARGTSNQGNRESTQKLDAPSDRKDPNFSSGCCGWKALWECTATGKANALRKHQWSHRGPCVRAH